MTTTATAASTPPPSRTMTLTLPGGIEITVDDSGRTTPFLVLHGGGGVATVTGFAALLAERTHSRVLVPTHPGFSGSPRSESLSTTRDLAAAYVDLLDQLDLADVTVVGNSFGGWLAAEIALLHSPRVVGAVIVDGVGIEVADHPMTSVAGLALADLQKLSFHDPARAPRAAGAAPSPDIAALISYTGPAMSDPTLLERLGSVRLPVHVLWGASDGIVSPAYGRAFADAIPGSRFTLLPETGHLPQVESPERLLAAITDGAR